MRRLRQRPQRHRALLIATTASLIVAAIGVSVSAESSEDGPPITIQHENLVPDAKQAQLLADGVISDAEMRQTLERLVKCVADRGYEAELVQFSPGEGWRLQTRGETQEVADAAEGALTACQNAGAAAVMDKYMADRIPPPSR